MKANDLRKQKTAYYRWQKLRLEALLAVAHREEEFINTIRKAQDIEDAKKSIASHFNLSSSQVYYLLGFELRKFGALEYDDLQKEYEKVVSYCQILGLNNKKL